VTNDAITGWTVPAADADALAGRIAEALALAPQTRAAPPPIIYRAAGNNAEFSRTVLQNCGLEVIAAISTTNGVQKALAAAAQARLGAS